jgi:hypothetical protein
MSTMKIVYSTSFYSPTGWSAQIKVEWPEYWWSSPFDVHLRSVYDAEAKKWTYDLSGGWGTGGWQSGVPFSTICAAMEKIMSFAKYLEGQLDHNLVTLGLINNEKALQKAIERSIQDAAHFCARIEAQVMTFQQWADLIAEERAAKNAA